MPMRRVLISVMTGLVMLMTAGMAGAGEGQVITPELREWARKTIQEEKRVTAAAGINTLMVLYYRNTSGDRALDPLQKGLTLMLISDLSQVPHLQILERVRLQALMEELGLGTSGLVAPETVPRAGKLVGAQWAVGGDLAVPVKERLAVTSRLLEVPDARILGQPATEGALAELLQLEKEVVFEIVKLLQITVSPETAARLRRPASTSMTALYSLFNGVDASDRGEYQKAANLYADALEADPGIIVARDALEQLKAMQYVPYSDRDTSIPMKKKLSETIRSTSQRTSLTNSLSEPDVTKSTPIMEIKNTPVNVNVNFPRGGQ